MVRYFGFLANHRWGRCSPGCISGPSEVGEEKAGEAGIHSADEGFSGAFFLNRFRSISPNLFMRTRFVRLEYTIYLNSFFFTQLQKNS